MTKTRNTITRAPHRSWLYLVENGGKASTVELAQRIGVSRTVAKSHLNAMLDAGLVTRHGPINGCWYTVVTNPPPFDIVQMRPRTLSPIQIEQLRRLNERNLIKARERRAAKAAEQNEIDIEDEGVVHRLVPAGQWRVNRLRLPPNSVWQFATHTGASA